MIAERLPTWERPADDPTLSASGASRSSAGRYRQTPTAVLTDTDAVTTAATEAGPRPPRGTDAARTS